MSILDLIKSRRSIRRFKSKPIPEDLIASFKDAILWAPSAGNAQARKFLFIFDERIKKGLVEAAWDQSFIAEAPLVIVGCADSTIGAHYGRRGVELYMLQDVAASVENLLLLVHEQGLGAVWIGAFDEKKAHRVLDLQRELRPVTIMPIGYPDERPSPPRRVSDKEAFETRR